MLKMKSLKFLTLAGREAPQTLFEESHNQ